MKRLSLLVLISTIWACTEERSSVQKYQVSFSEEISLDIGEMGMSSQVPFSISPIDRAQQSFLIFNEFYRRLDSVSFSDKNIWILPGRELPVEGPGSIPNFRHFTFVKDRVVFINSNDIYFVEDENTVDLNITRELDNGLGELKSINGADGRNNTFQAASLDADFLAFIFKDVRTGKFSLAKYDFNDFEEVPFLFDLDQMLNHRISFEKGPMTVSNSYAPYLTVFDSTIIISYPFFNKISKINLNSQKQSDFLYESELFKKQKDLPEKTSGFKDMAEYSEVGSKWNNDVYYGSIFRLDDNLMYRMVFENQMSNKVFLELFDNTFEKVGEFDLTEIEPDLKSFHLTVEGKILIQSSKDPDEDIFKYFLISVDPI